MKEKDYYQLATACDKILRHGDSTIEVMSIPWLHILNAHPSNIKKYRQLYGSYNSSNSESFREKIRYFILNIYQFVIIAKILLRSIINLLGRINLSESKNDYLRSTNGSQSNIKYDVLVISWLVDPSHINISEDFYFGSLQSSISENGKSSLLVLQNQTKVSYGKLQNHRKGRKNFDKLILPDILSPLKEFQFIFQAITAYVKIRKAEISATTSHEKQVAHQVLRECISNELIRNCRLHFQISELCKRYEPSVVLTLYEGHAWERCVFHAVQNSLPSAVRVAYQHTSIWENSHAVKRAIGASKNCDPDLILTVGNLTRKIIEESQDIYDIRLQTLGTHRRDANEMAAGPQSSPFILVLPEGIESESINLFNFAIECAKCLPAVQFKFRTHPVLPFELIRSKLNENKSIPDNIIVSENTSLADDFSHSGYLLYRGSSTVIYAILAGLKPFYVNFCDDFNIDPLYMLSGWREHVHSVEEFVDNYKLSRAKSQIEREDDWLRARSLCNEYVQPINYEVITHLQACAKVEGDFYWTQQQ